MENEFYDKYRLLVWHYVNEFYGRSPVHKNPIIDPDDLFQECMMYLYELFVKSGKPMSEFQFRPLDFRHCICCCVQQNLPFSAPKRTSGFTELCNRYTSVVVASSAEPRYYRDIAEQEDADLRIDLDLFSSRLDDLECEIFGWILSGKVHGRRTEIMKKHGITPKKFVCTYKRVLRNFKEYMQGGICNV